MLLQAFRYIFFVNTMDRAVLFQIQSNLISFLRRITYKWNKCIFILFLFGPLGIRVAAQVETDDSFLPIGMWAGISGTKNYLLQFRKKMFSCSRLPFLMELMGGQRDLFFFYKAILCVSCWFLMQMHPMPITHFLSFLLTAMFGQTY